MSDRLRDRLAATTRADRFVVAVVFLLFAGVYLAPPLYFFADATADCRSRFRYGFLRPEFIQSASNILCRDTGWERQWTDAKERPLAYEFCLHPDQSPPSAHRLADPSRGIRAASAYLSSAKGARDRWGNRWVLVVTPFGGEGAREFAYYSPGPNGVFEWGEGDDIRVAGPGMAKPLDPSDPWLWLVLVAAALGLPYLTWRVHRFPRSPSFATELSRATAMTLAPAALALAVAVRARELPFVPEHRLEWLVVPDRIALFLTCTAIAWVAALYVRLSKTTPEVPEVTSRPPSP